MAYTWTRNRTGLSSSRTNQDRTREAVWMVKGATSVDQIEGDILSGGSGVPNLRTNSLWVDNPASDVRLQRVVISREGSAPDLFKVQAFWSTPPDGGEHEDDENPLSQPPRYQWATINASEPVERDAAGNPIFASSRRGFDPKVTRDFNAKQLTISRNEPAFNITTALQYENTVNASPWKGAAAGEVRCTHIGPSQDFSTSASYVTVEYTFEFRSVDIWGEDPHQPKVLDQDTVAFANVDGVASPVRLAFKATGEAVDRDVPLNGLGTPIDPAPYSYLVNGVVESEPSFAPQSPPSGAQLVVSDAVFLVYQVYPERNFSQLGL